MWTNFLQIILGLWFWGDAKCESKKAEKEKRLTVTPATVAFMQTLDYCFFREFSFV